MSKTQAVVDHPRRLSGTRLHWFFCLAIVFYGSTVIRGVWKEVGPAAYQAKISCVNPIVDLGDLQIGEPVVQEFTISNIGAKPLTISGVSTSCSCVRALIGETVVPPGHEVQLPVAVNVSVPSESLSQSLTVHSDDAALPELILKIKGRITIQDANQNSRASANHK